MVLSTYMVSVHQSIFVVVGQSAGGRQYQVIRSASMSKKNLKY